MNPPSNTNKAHIRWEINQVEDILISLPPENCIEIHCYEQKLNELKRELEREEEKIMFKGINFLDETLEAIKNSGHTPDDIMFIGSLESGYECTWDEFKALANREYDNGYGSPEIATDIRIYFTDGQSMWRGEYDGSEWWAFTKPFVKPKQSHKITSLFSRDNGHIGWNDLHTLNDELEQKIQRAYLECDYDELDRLEKLRKERDRGENE